MYARFQPRTADFQKDVGDDMRATLEAALARHSTLTEGAWISVPFADQAFELLVQKLRPGRAVSVIGTRAPLFLVLDVALANSSVKFGAASLLLSQSRRRQGVTPLPLLAHAAQTLMENNPAPAPSSHCVQKPMESQVISAGS